MPLATRALALLSGGLDSALAIRVVQEQGIEVEGLHFVSVFNGTAPQKPGVLTAVRVGRQLGIGVTCVNFTREQLALVRDPAYGLGANMNPCIDCHLAMLRRAGDLLPTLHARFIVTGEVLGQRPMSQRRFALDLIRRKAAIGDVILRPLSARHLPPTQPEREGWVDREGLLDISGRSRARQLELARQWGLTEHASPAGGCLLTDPGFSRRLRDLLAHTPAEADVDLFDLHLLKVGRHFRLDPHTKAIVGRNQRDNGVVFTFSRPTDRLLVLRDALGPTTLLKGNLTAEHVRTAAALTVRYSKLRDAPAAAVAIHPGRHDIFSPVDQAATVAPIDPAAATRLRV